VDSLLDKHFFLDPVLSALQANPELANGLHETASRLARSKRPTGDQLNFRAWDLVDPDRDEMQTDVALALRLARASVELRPEDSASRNTLAWALFANNHFDEAVVESTSVLRIALEDDKVKSQVYLDRLHAKIDVPGKSGADDVEPKSTDAEDN
jgi:hypothetical protein